MACCVQAKRAMIECKSGGQMPRSFCTGICGSRCGIGHPLHAGAGANFGSMQERTVTKNRVRNCRCNRGEKYKEQRDPSRQPAALCSWVERTEHVLLAALVLVVFAFRVPRGLHPNVDGLHACAFKGERDVKAIAVL